ncbi:phosphatase PAP2 family protein [Patescibacteria group bacterium]|nr:phosphatase PAP2 family protein [Patescibacteria group bacterium]
MDLFIFQQINQFVFKWLWLDTFAIFFAKYFGYILVILLVLFLFKNFKKYWQMVVSALLAAILARLVIVEIIRYFLPRARPFVENSINVLINHSQESAFPSGHASFFFAIATIVYFYNKKAGIFFFLASFLIGLARVFSGIHWPSDILIGALVGILSAHLLIRILKKFAFLNNFL